MLESPSIAANAKNGTMASYGNDTMVYAEFELEAVLDQFKSDETGIPHYHDVEMITILTPGNNKNTFRDKVNPLYIQRFPKQYAAFKSQNEMAHDGLPLTEWPVVTKAQALNLKSAKIFTVEQLSEILDQNLDVLGLGGRDLRDKAKAYLDRSVGAKEITQLFARVNKLEAESAAKDELIAQLKGEKNETLKLKKG